MKTLTYLFAFAMLLFAGCAKDEMFDDNQNSFELKKAKVPIPMKADLLAVPDMESSLLLKPGGDPTDPASYVTSKMKISGNCTHTGLLNVSKSYYEIVTFELIIEDNIPYLHQTGTGHIVGANGDCFDYTWWATATIPDLNYIGKIVLTGGTGKFEGCSGTLQMQGKIDDIKLENKFTVEGMMEFN